MAITFRSVGVALPVRLRQLERESGTIAQHDRNFAPFPLPAHPLDRLLMTNWRDGTTGAFQMGFRHGAYCFGSCWALMCVLFVVGVMNLIWVAAPTGFFLIEKTGPAGCIVARVAGAAMVVLGIVAIA